MCPSSFPLCTVALLRVLGCLSIPGRHPSLRHYKDQGRARDHQGAGPRCVWGILAGRLWLMSPSFLASRKLVAKWEPATPCRSGPGCFVSLGTLARLGQLPPGGAMSPCSGADSGCWPGEKDQNCVAAPPARPGGFAAPSLELALPTHPLVYPLGPVHAGGQVDSANLGFSPCRDPASEARGHPSWAFKCLTSLHCGRLSGRRRVFLRLSEIIWTPPILSPAPVWRGARWLPQGRSRPQFNYSTWGRFAPFLLAAELTPQI